LRKKSLNNLGERSTELQFSGLPISSKSGRTLEAIMKATPLDHRLTNKLRQNDRIIEFFSF
jgi:hypothetical protein